MNVQFAMVPADNIFYTANVSALDATRTISKNLDKRELTIYMHAMGKVQTKQKLNKNDVKVLDKIDAITMNAHGFCLKDSKVTQARIKACKRYGIRFNDRDGLEAHMNAMLYSA